MSEHNAARTVETRMAANSCFADDLAFKVRKVAEASVPLTMKTGKPLKIRRYWLDIDYPYRPPIEYRRSGYAMLLISTF